MQRALPGIGKALRPELRLGPEGAGLRLTMCTGPKTSAMAKVYPSGCTQETFW